MDEKELRETITEIKKQVWAKEENKNKSEDEIDEIILDGFFEAYTEGKMSKSDLESIAGVLGYELTDDFDKEAPEEVKDEKKEKLEKDIKEQEFQYYRTFNQFPPIPPMMAYPNPEEYVWLLRKAILNKKLITFEEICDICHLDPDKIY